MSNKNKLYGGTMLCSLIHSEIFLRNILIIRVYHYYKYMYKNAAFQLVKCALVLR